MIWRSCETVALEGLIAASVGTIAYALARFWPVAIDTNFESRNGTNVFELMIEAGGAVEPRWKFAIYFTARRARR